MVICFSFHLPLLLFLRLTTYTKYFTPSSFTSKEQEIGLHPKVAKLLWKYIHSIENLLMPTKRGCSRANRRLIARRKRRSSPEDFKVLWARGVARIQRALGKAAKKYPRGHFSDCVD